MCDLCNTENLNIKWHRKKCFDFGKMQPEPESHAVFYLSYKEVVAYKTWESSATGREHYEKEMDQQRFELWLSDSKSEVVTT